MAAKNRRGARSSGRRRQETVGARLDEHERQELDSLRVEVEDLRTELTARREQRRKFGRRALAGGSFILRIATRFFIGWELTGSMRKWLEAIRRWAEAKAPADSIPIEETADVAAAIARRWLRVGLWHVVLASGGVITAGILIWQGFLIRGQIKQQQTQNELIRAQNEQQAADTLIVRRAQLLDTIYTEECENTGDPETCKPTANPRAVREAVAAFVKIERDRGELIDLSEANLSGVNLVGVDLSGVQLLRADLSDAYLDGVNLSDAVLSGANLTGAELFLAELNGANLAGANLSQTLISFDPRQVDLRGANLSGTNLKGRDLTWRDLSRADLSGADLSGTNLSKAKLIGTKLIEADLTKANLTGANLTGADLSGALLSEAVLTGALLYHAKLIGAKLIKADLSIAWLIDADLSRADLSEADLNEALLVAYIGGADLSKAYHISPLALVCGDQTTKLPEGFDRPESWPCRIDFDESEKPVRVVPLPPDGE